MIATTRRATVYFDAAFDERASETNFSFEEILKHLKRRGKR